VEYRVADASACPYLALGAVIWAGVDGLTRRLSLPERDADAPLLPRSLEEALGALERSEHASRWWGQEALGAYLAFKRAEIEALSQANPDEICARYAAVY
jgi:glutamine synthetase